MERNIFKIAVKEKFRFSFRGMISVEDLYDLSEKQLNDVFKVLNVRVKQSNEESLLETKSKADENLEIKIEIVKTIFAEKKAERLAVLKEKEVKERKQKLLGLLDKKDNEKDENMSREEIIKELDSLG